ncbi:DUF4825 domain-containing protein [Intrasporangium sp. YIM S08009]|uniref:DUF4825 domain-containing protein n=1 Tax=Intrasporangium zincisolvens TaxID=3080018 RepID=UPI002B0592B4|nr:DUF4825 domain-containing protein [Intrasporangium sp. YIM S08009]
MPRQTSPRPPVSRACALAALTIVAAATLLSGCSATSGRDATPSEAPTDASGRLVASLWADRTAHVGDNIRVIALVGDSGLDDLGPRTISLQTGSEPYGLTVRYPAPVKSGGPFDATPQATLLLGTVGNLDHVTVVANGSTFTLTAADASRALGHDVKQLGTDHAALARYVSSLDD